MAKEDEFRQLYESSRDALMTLPAGGGRFLSGNPAAIALFRCENEEQFKTLSPQDISPEFQPDGTLSSVKAAAMVGKAVEQGINSFEWVHRRVDGTDFWAEVLLTRMNLGGQDLLQASVRDISDRKQTEEQIRQLNQDLEQRIAERTAELLETTERIRKLIDTANDAVVTIDVNSIVIDWNSAAERIFGWNRGEAMGRKLHHMIVPEKFRAMHEAGMKRFIETGQGTIINRRIEIRALHRAGHEIDIELSIWPVRARKSYTFSAFARDISDRKRMESQLMGRAEKIRSQRDALLELAQSEKSDFPSALTAILQAAAVTLKVERVSFWRLAKDASSIVCEQLYRLSEGKLDEGSVGLRLDAADFPHYFAAVMQRQPLAVDDARTHPATRDFTVPYLDVHGITSMFDAAVWFEGELIGVVCHEHVGELRSWLPEEVDFGGSIATMISLSLEASNRAEAEQELRELQAELKSTLAEREAVLENSSVGICFLRDRRFVWVNRTMEHLCGYERSEINGRPITLLCPESEQARMIEEAFARISGSGSFSLDIELLQKSGELLWCRLSGRPIDAGNPLGGSIWTIEDISERIRAENEIRKTLEKERELNELKTRFVSMTSHEFRTPLSTVLSSTELLEHYHDRLPECEKQDLFKSIRTAVQRMTLMMNDVLVIGRADSEQFELNPQPLCLKKFCGQLVEEFRRSAPAGIVFDYEPSEGPEVPMDEKLLRYILNNLLSNAVKYSPGGGTVKFVVGRLPDRVEFTVRDHGIGIPEEDQARLFESFHRARNVGNISGTGLGLSIVKKAVDRHGGTIRVDSRAAAGTTFHVSIPIEAAP